MNVGSLFSGIGGLDAGLARAGFRHSFLCESDPWRRDVLRARFPGVPVYDDVRDVGRGCERGCTSFHPGCDYPDCIAPDREPSVRRHGTSTDASGGEVGGPGRNGRPIGVDLLAGGFPCQDLSVAGRRAGLEAGERSSLFFEFARVADELVRPGGYVLIENVPGLLSSQGGRDFAIVLATLAEFGFHDLAWRVLDSRYFGVPQRRRRVFLLGRRASGQRCAQVLLESESGGGDSAAGGEAGAGASFASLSGLESGGPDDNDAQGGRLVAALTTRAGNTQDDQQSQQLVTAFTWRALGGTDHTERQSAPSLRCDDSASIRDGAAVRRLTPIECERLQSLPDDWTRVPDDAPDSRRYAGLGDAVTANVAEWLGTRLLAVETQEVAA